MTLGKQRYRWLRNGLSTALWALLLSGCTRHVELIESFPEPVIERQPYAVGLWVEDEFRDYVHHEEIDGGPDWEISFGQTHVNLFRQVLPGLFERVVMVESLEQGLEQATDVQAVINPVMVDYQFSTPQQSKTDYYEVWIKYRLQVYGRDGKLISDWPFTAYGRKASGFGQGREALRTATRRAMRDAAAAVVLEFMEQPGVEAYFKSTAGGGGANGGQR